MLGFSKFEIAGAVGALVAVVALPWALLASAEAARAKAEVQDLRARIEAPQTGYIAQLERCRGNTATLEAGLARQNEAVTAWKAEAERRQREGAAAVARAQADTREARRRADAIVTAGVRPGEDQCAAVSRLIEENLS